MVATSSLFEIVGSEQSIAPSLRDPSFCRNRAVALHRWVPWVAGFSADFVQDSLSKYLPKRSSSTCVLDPFAGVGTTLLEAYLTGCDVVGFEINPYAALACDVKLTSMLTPVKRLEEYLRKFEKFMARTESSPRREPRSRPPEGFNGRTELFSPRVQRKALFVLDYIAQVEETPIRNIFLLAFGSVMVSFSNYSYEPSLTRRSAVGKPDIRNADVALVVADKVRSMLADITELQRDLRNRTARPRTLVVPDSFMSAESHFSKREFVDLVVTSPPYLNNYHYPRNTRPQLHWLGLGNGRGYGSANEEMSFGKFWQTVRGKDVVALAFEFPELSWKINSIRGQNAAKGPYGGPGWANYAATYFNDTYKFSQVLWSLMKPGARAVIVLGNSVIQGVEVRTDQFFGRIAEMCGWTFEETLLLRKKRTGSSIIQSSVRVDKAPSKVALYESAIVLRK